MPEPTLVPLPGSERYEQPGATRVGPVPADEMIQFSVVVRPRMGAPYMGEVAPNAAIAGQFLSREELADAEALTPPTFRRSRSTRGGTALPSRVSTPSPAG